MADIDKSLPNEAKPILPGEEPEELEIMESGEQPVLGETEIMENEDGSVDIDFDPSQLMQGAAEDHNANLADFLD